MTKFKEGDLVEAGKGDDLHRGRVFHDGSRLCLGKIGFSLGYYEREGWTMTLIEAAKLEAPTEPGYYQTRSDGPGLKAGWTLHLASSGLWWWVGPEHRPYLSVADRDEVASYAPLIKLEPVAETAKKVLARVADEALDVLTEADGVEALAADDLRHDLAAIAAEFGVEDD